MHVDFKDLLAKYQIDPADVLMLRHTPPKQAPRRVLPWLAANRPLLFKAYQQLQQDVVEERFKKAAYISSFIGRDDGSTVFAGLYERRNQESKTRQDVLSIPEIQELLRYRIEISKRSPRLWFDLRLRDDFFPEWRGKLAVDWPGAKRNYHRFADQADFNIAAIYPESVFAEAPLPESYADWDVRWDELPLLAESWKAQLRSWRGVYYIFDVSDGKGYVGKASGKENLLGRWSVYKDTGHGGNQKLQGRDPENFRFSILELVPQDMDDVKIEEREQNWMIRLRTRTRTHGLNLPELDY